MRQTSIVMASLVTGLGIFAGLAFAPTPFTQQAAAGNGFDPNYRYCVSTGFGGRFQQDIPDCAFTTLAQCQMSASGRGYCIENPGYAPRARRAAPRRASG